MNGNEIIRNTMDSIGQKMFWLVDRDSRSIEWLSHSTPNGKTSRYSRSVQRRMKVCQMLWKDVRTPYARLDCDSETDESHGHAAGIA